MKFYATARLSENILTTPEGYLICVGVPIARTGEMEYGKDETPIQVGDNGKAVIIRETEEVFRPETLKSFEGKPVTIMHPDDLVTPETWGELAKGVIQNVRRGEGTNETDLIADLLITDAAAIKLVKDGLREVSCGYEADYYQLGVGRGEQKNIIGNHLALVTQGRAGSSYAINDHKGKGLTMKLGDKIKAIFAKAQDEAVRAAANDEMPVEVPPAASYDELCKAVKDLGAKVDAMGKTPAAVDAVPTTPMDPAKVEAKDEPVAPSLEDRLKKLEEMVTGLMQAKASAGDEDVEMEKTEDGDDDEDVEVDDAKEDEKEPKKDKVGDSAPTPEEEEDGEIEEDLISRAEILAPGIKKDQKNLKAKSIKVAYATVDGKAAIDVFTGGKTPDLKDEKFIDAVFVGVSEILKVKRAGEFSKTKTFDFKSNLGIPEGVMTPEKVNEMNAKHYGGK